jgi:hypothetical protein
MGKFSVLYEKMAQAARDNCCQTYGASEEINEWLRSLVRDVESNSATQSLTSAEVVNIVLVLLGNSKFPGQWQNLWERFRDAPFADKLQAIFATIASKRPPWELRVAFETFFFLSGAFSQRVFVYYEIDRTNSRIVFRKFGNLPGT